MSNCIYELNLLWFSYFYFKGLTYKQKFPSYLTSRVINLTYTCSDSQVLLNTAALHTNITKRFYCFSFKVTGLNLTKQLYLLIWNQESNLSDALYVKLS